MIRLLRSTIIFCSIFAVAFPSPLVAEERILWSNLTSASLKSDPPGTGTDDTTTIISSDFNAVTGLDYDSVNQKIYWGDNGSSIRRANPDGSDPEEIVSGLGDPRDVALDVANNKVYWTDTSTDKISRSDLDGSNVVDILGPGDGLMNVLSIALDLTNGKIYWADNDADTINRANVDGSVVETIVSGIGLNDPRGVQIFGSKVYWVDGTNDTIQRADLDGSNVETIYSSLSDPRDLSITADGSAMYWVQFGDSTIREGTIDNSAGQSLSIDDTGNLQALRHIELFPEIDISGNGMSIPNGDTTPSPDDNTDFGSQSISGDETEKFIRVNNEGFGILSITGNPRVSFSGPNASDFRARTSLAPTIAGRDDRGFLLAFKPGDRGLRTATLTITSDDADESSYSFQIQGFGTDPDIVVKESGEVISYNQVLDMGTVAASGGSATKTFTIHNEGNVDMLLSGDPRVRLSRTYYRLGSDAEAIIPVGGSSTFSVIFDPYNPFDTRPLSTSVTLYSNDGNSSPFQFYLTGYGDGSGDRDNDGLIDRNEKYYGTNYRNSDSDGDGVKDGAEINDGTNPRDSGSFLRSLGNRICVEWNGFLPFLTQIFEVLNTSYRGVIVELELFDINGIGRSDSQFRLETGEQFDVIVNNLEGFEENTVGLLCVKRIGGPENSLDGQLVTYRFTDNSYTLAASAELLPSFSGPLYLVYNTYQPSIQAGDQGNFVANWAQLINEEESEQSGSFVLYSQEGDELASIPVNLGAKQRGDFDLHRIGPFRTGLAAWRPDSDTAKFRLRQNRYYYGAQGLVSLREFVSLPGMKASGEEVVTTFDSRKRTATLEIANVLNQPVTVTLSVRDENGALAPGHPTSFILAARGTVGYVLNEILPEAIGSVRITSSERESLLVTRFEYGRGPGGSLLYANPSTLAEAIGTVLRGSYNSFLNQGCRLRLVNLLDTEQEARISMTRYDGTSIIESQPLNVPGNGTIEFDLCAAETMQAYGQVLVETDLADAFAAETLRINAEGNIEFSNRLK